MKYVLPLALTVLATTPLLAGCVFGKKAEEKKLIEIQGPSKLQIFGAALYNVSVTTVEQKDLPDVLTIMGKISPTEDRTTVVPARATGRIDSIAVASGETVKDGDRLATIASPDFAAAREEYLQSLKQSQHDKEGSSDFAGITKMSRRRLILMGLSEKDVDALANKEPANSGLIDTTLSLVVHSPRSGAVITKGAVIGNQVNVGDTLFTIADLSKVWFLGDVYPEDLSKIKKDQTVTVDSGTAAGKLNGKISFISPVVDPATRTVKVRALIDNPKLSLRADLYTQGGVVVDHTEALVVPAEAILHEGESDYVFRVVNKETKEKSLASLTLEKVKVAIGIRSQGLAGISSGLTKGDEIAGKGALLLNAALQSSENNQ